ncbi:polysaccharide biosynthesis C-terminal domain-containing protein [Pseudarthrobacter sp. alpha12b]
MSRTALTGAGGFLGFHTRALLHSLGQEVDAVLVGDAFNEDEAIGQVDGVDRLIHLAGVNRGTEAEVTSGNVRFAEQLVRVLTRCKTPPSIVVYANSIQAGNKSVYGVAKEEAGRLLGEAAERLGIEFIDLKLPNLFGEHGKPFYNSVTATFCHLLARGEQPQIQSDKILSLMHAQYAAELAVGVRRLDSMDACVVELHVSELLSHLKTVADTYSDGTIPRLNTAFDRDIFNTYRSYLRPEDRVFNLSRHADTRGSFFEIVKSELSSGQTSFSTTVPGITRGQHFHLRKIERFTVLSGSGEISMRRLFDDEVIRVKVDGRQPVAIDMPTMWPHSISNIGTDILYTAFWINELFDPESPDTFAEDV